ncbi:MAG: 4-(cytidine 5'-diphospho)-2-C-methyl-D-erythritol kinase [Candidatus Omnitrophica bacterium]|jgi:4-diphosphocytidyl-2-C-methyl-D-erythritol kinase|nr:4-(cytidine 5'-diphospho)-2-C-methyl-D-erythritol kinase [Candidatus Omnitrophota bacterium]MDD5660642.1 4-(cytidine 5'-diphospho)-2-C-methyl-D-erythritol kinase [Candidatus Omnitrophota bacterium]
MKQPCPPLVIKSFAKLNLYLQVLNKRKDQFHNLNTLFCRIDLADTIILKKRKDNLIKIKCDSRHVPSGPANLCWRAAWLLRRKFNLKTGLTIEIKKRIPVGAGLGGGSSNAASVILGLNKYWHLNLPKKKLASLGAAIGSDIAFFIYNAKFAEARGRGEKINPLSSLAKLKLWFILVYPHVKVSTPLIYRKFDKFSQRNPDFGQTKEVKKQDKNQGAGLTIPRPSVKIFASELLKNGQGFKASYLVNDLEVITSSLYPVVKQVKKSLSNIGLEKIMMSGSGPAVFAVCSSYKQAKDLSGRLARKHKSWQVFVTSAI